MTVAFFILGAVAQGTWLVGKGCQQSRTSVNFPISNALWSMPTRVGGQRPRGCKRCYPKRYRRVQMETLRKRLV